MDPLRTCLAAAALLLAAPALPLATESQMTMVPRGAAAFDAVEIDVRDLTTIEWAPGDTLPEEISRLDGKKVAIRGYMHQSVESETDTFPMVSDSCQCNDTLLPHHYVEIKLTGKKTGPVPGEFEVIGKLAIGEVKDEDGFVVSLYRLSRAEVL